MKQNYIVCTAGFLPDPQGVEKACSKIKAPKNYGDAKAEEYIKNSSALFLDEKAHFHPFASTLGYLAFGGYSEKLLLQDTEDVLLSHFLDGIVEFQKQNIPVVGYCFKELVLPHIMHRLRLWKMRPEKEQRTLASRTFPAQTPEFYSRFLSTVGIFNSMSRMGENFSFDDVLDYLNLGPCTISGNQPFHKIPEADRTTAVKERLGYEELVCQYVHLDLCGD